jgi:hypothetical protein
VTTSFTVETGAILYDTEGSKIGPVTDILTDDLTLKPEWYEVKVGLVGGHYLVPAEELTVDGGRYVVPFGKDQIKAAPKVERPPLEGDRVLLRRHYGLPEHPVPPTVPPAV